MGASDWVSFRSFGLLLLNLFLHDPTRLTVQRLTRSQAGIQRRPALTWIRKSLPLQAHHHWILNRIRPRRRWVQVCTW